MSYGINIVNADSYLTFNEDKIYYQFKEKLQSSKATVMFGQRFYWDTDYTGSKYPIVFIYSNGYWASIIDTYRLANNKWRIEVWTEGTKATVTKNNITGYLFTEGSESTTNPSWGIRINDASGNRAYDSDFAIMRIKDFATMPAPSSSYLPSSFGATLCQPANSGTAGGTSNPHGVTGLSKPCALLYSNGTMQYPKNYLCGWFRYYCGFAKSIQKVTSANVEHTWGHMGDFIYNVTMKVVPSNYITPIIDGADYD
jgi:hypothetical protein